MILTELRYIVAVAREAAIDALHETLRACKLSCLSMLELPDASSAIHRQNLSNNCKYSNIYYVGLGSVDTYPVAALLSKNCSDKVREVRISRSK